MYILVLGVLFVATILSIVNQKQYIKFAYITLFVIFVMNGVRFGGNGDYFNYLFDYIGAPSSLSLSYLFANTHMEIGYKFIVNIFRIINVSYTGFNLCVAIFEFICIKRFIWMFSQNYCISVLIFYCMFNGTYFSGAVRQGLALSIFLGIMIPLLIHSKILLYIFFNILAISIHSSAIILLIIPIILYLRIKPWYISFIMSLFLSVIMAFGTNMIGANEITYLTSTDISFFNIVFNVMMIIFIGSYYYKLDIAERKINILFKCYFYGFLIYVMLIFFSIASQRVFIYFNMIILVLIPYTLDEVKSAIKEKIIAKKRIHILVYSFVLFYILGYFFKNQMMYIEWNYFEEVNVINYPYVSVFNEELFYKHVTKYPLHYKDLN